MRLLAFLIALLLLASSAYAKPPRVNGVAWIGDLELRFDANRWEVNGADGAYDVYCNARDCNGTWIAIAIAGEGETACTPEALTFEDGLRSSPASTDRFNRAGLTFLVAEGDFGCRNLAGGPVRACTSHDGRTYTLHAPGQQCHTSPHASQFVNEILEGLKPR
jgi:hypothetical protein